MSRSQHETEAEYEKRLHVEAEYEIAVLLGEEPHAMSREMVATFKPYLSRVELTSLGWYRDFARDRWIHDSGAILDHGELMLLRQPEAITLAARRIRDAKSTARQGMPMSLHEIDELRNPR